MSRTKYHRQTPRTDDETSRADDETTAERKENGTGDAENSSPMGAFEELIEEMVESRTAELRAELRELERQIEAVDDFARISLNERKVEQNEEKLSEFSESLTAFAEKAFNNINALEDRLDTHALLLAAIVDALEQDEIDLSEVRRYQNERLIADVSPDERVARIVASRD